MPLTIRGFFTPWRKHPPAALVAIVLFLLQGIPSSAQVIKVGVIAGTEAQVMEIVKEVAAKDGLKLEVLVFSDPKGLNAAVDDGSLDANSFQDLPSLESDVQAHRYKLADVAYTITLPMAFYSRKIRSFRELKPGDIVAVPGDASNTARAIILLHNYGLIQFRDEAALAATPADITDNPRKLKIVQVDSAHITESLQTAAAVALPFPLASQAGLYPARDSIAMEDARCPYAGVLVTRSRDSTAPWVTKLVKAYHSSAVKQFILTQFKDSVRRPW